MDAGHPHASQWTDHPQRAGRGQPGENRLPADHPSPHPQLALFDRVRMKKQRGRDRIVYASLIVMVIVLGIGSRKIAPWLPLLLKKNAGDILWALMVFLLCGWLL